LNIRDKIH